MTRVKIISRIKPLILIRGLSALWIYVCVCMRSAPFLMIYSLIKVAYARFPNKVEMAVTYMIREAPEVGGDTNYKETG